MKNLLSIFTAILLTANLSAQDFIFNQFHESPLNLSPALAGSNCGNEFIINFRNQAFNNGLGGSVSFRTFSASYDQPVTLKNGDKIGWGLRLGFSDANVVSLRSTLISLAFNYQKRISPEDSKAQYITGGLDVGGGQLSADFFSTGGTARDSDLFSDVSVGLGYKYELDSRNDIQIGASLTHLQQPEIVFETAGSFGQIARRFTGYAIVGFPISPRLDIRPRVFHTNSNNGGGNITTATIGARLAGYTHQFEISVGVQSIDDNVIERNTSLILGATYFYNNFGIMVSREFNTSSLITTNLGSITEATIIYRPCQKSWVDNWEVNDDL